MYTRGPGKEESYFSGTGDGSPSIEKKSCHLNGNTFIPVANKKNVGVYSSQ